MRNTAERIERLERRLASIDEAIEAVLAGQSYKLGSRSVTRANLSELRAYQRDTEAEIDRLEAYGTTRRRFKRAVPGN